MNAGLQAPMPLLTGQQERHAWRQGKVRLSDSRGAACSEHDWVCMQSWRHKLNCLEACFATPSHPMFLDVGCWLAGTQNGQGRLYGLYKVRELDTITQVSRLHDRQAIMCSPSICATIALRAILQDWSCHRSARACQYVLLTPAKHVSCSRFLLHPSSSHLHDCSRTQ